jgi:hypothetical protein
MNPYKPSALGNQLQGQFFKRGVINCKWKFLGEIDLTGCSRNHGSPETIFVLSMESHNLQILTFLTAYLFAR